MIWFNIYNRRLYAVIVGFGAAFGMTWGHQPLVWIAITFVGGVILGWFTAPGKPSA